MQYLTGYGAGKLGMESMAHLLVKEYSLQQEEESLLCLSLSFLMLTVVTKQQNQFT